MREVILNSEPLGYSARARALWESVGYYVEGSIDDPGLAELRRRTTVLIVRLARRVDAAVLECFPNLRYLVSATTGLDHLDLGDLSERAVRLLSLRGETELLDTIPSTAEHTFALLLALLRHVPASVQSVGRGEWLRDSFRGRQLKDRRLGLIGLGRIGRMVAGYAEAFEARIGYYDPHVDGAPWRRFRRLEDLLGESEIVSLHLHLDSGTRHILGARELAMLPAGAWLINTSRGALVDEAALAELVRAGRIGGVATDVLASELDDPTASPLWQAMCAGHPVLITPHIGGATVDAMHQCEEFLAMSFIAHRCGVSGG